MMREVRSLATGLVFCFGCLAAACAMIRPVVIDDVGPECFAAVWDAFHAEFTRTCVSRDFFARGSVNLASADRSSRLLFSFWGRTDFPLRMDLQAGIGAMLAHWREDRHGWVGFHPGTGEAFASPDSRAGATVLGLAMPLRLNVLAQILTGCWSEVVPRRYLSAWVEQHHFAYLLEKEGNRMVLVLEQNGRPFCLREEDPQGWNVVIEDWSGDDAPTPRRMRLTQEDNVALVRVQRLDFSAVQWQDADLGLVLPPGATLRILEPLD